MKGDKQLILLINEYISTNITFGNSPGSMELKYSTVLNTVIWKENYSCL